MENVASGVVTSVVIPAQAKHPGAISKKSTSQLPQSPDSGDRNVQPTPKTAETFSNILTKGDLERKDISYEPTPVPSYCNERCVQLGRDKKSEDVFATHDQGNMRITNGWIVFLAVATIFILFMFLLVPFSRHASCRKGINLGQAKQHFHHWEDIHCQRRHGNKTTVEESWIPELAKQLNLDAEGTSVFDSNTGCNEWLKLIRKRYPKMKIGGAHVNQYAVEYAKRLFNDTPGTFGTISSDGKINFLVDGAQFAHAINYGGLKDLGDKEKQCNLVRELLHLIKPGGSMYLGHNIEENECRVLDKYSSVALPGCYWSEMCLKNRIDIAAIYYIKERDLFGAHSQIDDCYTAVFIHKKVITSQGKDGRENPRPRYTPHQRMYSCKLQESVAGKSIASNMKELTKHVVFRGSMYQGYKIAKNLQELSKNLSESHTLDSN